MKTLNSMCGETVLVELRVRDSRDGFGNYVEEYAAPITVPNVLVAPGPCADLDASRPEGVKVAMTLHFPKEWWPATTTTTTGAEQADRELRGARISLFGDYKGTYRVVGRPLPYMEQLTPAQWNMPVEVEVYDG